MRTGLRLPTATRPGKTRSRRNKARRSARSMMTGFISANSRSRWSWRRNGRSRATRHRWCGSTMTSSPSSPIFSGSAARPRSSKSRTSRAATRPRRSQRQRCVTRPSISFRPNITIRWSCSPRPRCGTAAASSSSTTRRRACRMCRNISAACSRRNPTRSRCCRPIWAAGSAPACGRNTRWCWR